MYDKLIKNRPKCKNFNCTISDIENEKVKLIGKMHVQVLMTLLITEVKTSYP